ncbi:MAG: tryptophan synthase subunit alpha [Desulfuromonadales bacterium]|nr:tryptophan synthase subunit alpha [Desulfuromonadales bacterium]
MTRLGQKFLKLAKEKDKALITFITAGDPDLKTTEQIVPLIAEAGADIIELGVPFSDPMADGAAIQKSSQRALASGTTLTKLLASVKNIRKHSDVPILLMGYYNPIYHYGLERFCKDAAKSGVDGVLIVDLPPEEADEFINFTQKSNIDLIFLLTPTSDKERIRKVTKIARGFIYYVSVTGITGARTSVADRIEQMIANIRKETKLPIAVGFGISTPEQAKAVSKIADGVVVGSALVKLFEQYSGNKLSTELTKAIKALKSGIKKN